MKFIIYTSELILIDFTSNGRNISLTRLIWTFSINSTDSALFESLGSKIKTHGWLPGETADIQIIDNDNIFEYQKVAMFILI